MVQNSIDDFEAAPSKSCCALKGVTKIYIPHRYFSVASTSNLVIDSTQLSSGVTVVRSIAKRLACLCVLLTIWSAVAFAAHQHSSATESATCTVCIAAHSAYPKTTNPLPRVMFASVSVFRPEPEVATKQRLIPFALSVRPPPSF